MVVAPLACCLSIDWSRFVELFLVKCTVCWCVLKIRAWHLVWSSCVCFGMDFMLVHPCFQYQFTVKEYEQYFWSFQWSQQWRRRSQCDGKLQWWSEQRHGSTSYTLWSKTDTYRIQVTVVSSLVVLVSDSIILKPLRFRNVNLSKLLTHCNWFCE